MINAKNTTKPLTRKTKENTNAPTAILKRNVETAEEAGNVSTSVLKHNVKTAREARYATTGVLNQPV